MTFRMPTTVHDKCDEFLVHIGDIDNLQKELTSWSKPEGSASYDKVNGLIVVLKRMSSYIRHNHLIISCSRACAKKRRSLGKSHLVERKLPALLWTITAISISRFTQFSYCPNNRFSLSLKSNFIHIN